MKKPLAPDCHLTNVKRRIYNRSHVPTYIDDQLICSPEKIQEHISTYVGRKPHLAPRYFFKHSCCRPRLMLLRKNLCRLRIEIQGRSYYCTCVLCKNDLLCDTMLSFLYNSEIVYPYLLSLTTKGGKTKSLSLVFLPSEQNEMCNINKTGNGHRIRCLTMKALLNTFR